MVEPTSLNAYLAMEPTDREALRKRIAVLMQNAGQPVSARTIHERSGIDLQSVTPRMAEMRDRGIVKHAGRVKNSTGKPAKVFALTENGARYAKGEWEPKEFHKAPRSIMVGRVIRAARRVAAADPVMDAQEWVAAHQENKAAVAALDTTPEED